MEKFVFAETLTGFKKAYPDHAEPTSVVYNSIGYTRDGYIYTHGVIMKASLTTEENPWGLSFNRTGQNLTVGLGNYSETVVLPVIGVNASDELNATTTGGIVTVKHNIIPGKTDNTTVGPISAGNINTNISVPNFVYNKFGHVISNGAVNAVLNQVLKSPSTANETMYLLMGNNSVEETGKTYFNVNIKANPSTGAFYASTLFENGKTLAEKYLAITHEEVLGTQVISGHVALSNSTTTRDYSDGVAATPKAVFDSLTEAKAYANGILAANEAMILAGTVDAKTGIIMSINSSLQTSVKPGTTLFTSLTNYNSGWTFKVTVAGNIVGIGALEIGDTIIASSTFVASFKNTDWFVIQANIDGAIISDSALTTDQLVIGKDGNKVIKTLAAGNAGQVLKMVGGAPKWSAETDTNTWRGIKVNSANFLLSDDLTDLNLIAGTGISLATASSGALTINAALRTFKIADYTSNKSIIYNPTAASNFELQVERGLKIDQAVAEGSPITIGHSYKAPSTITSTLGKVTVDLHGHVTKVEQVDSLKNPESFSFGVGDNVSLYDGSAAAKLLFTGQSSGDIIITPSFTKSTGVLNIGASVTHKYRPVGIKGTPTETNITDVLTNTSSSALILKAGTNVTIEKSTTAGEVIINSNYINNWRPVKARAKSDRVVKEVLGTGTNTGVIEFGDEFIYDDAVNSKKVRLGWAVVDAAGNVTYEV